MKGDVVKFCDALLGAAGRDADAGALPRLACEGRDPVLPTPFRIGEAAAAALLAVGVSSNDLWLARGGSTQQISVDVRATVAALLSFAWQRASGLSLDRLAPATVGLYRTRDGGWVHLHGGFPHLHRGTLEVLDCTEDAGAITAAVLRRDAAELEDTLAARRLCGARLRAAEEWRRHPQGVASGRVPVVELIRIGEAEPTPVPGPGADALGARPLSGVRVLDVTRVLAGPTCARTLAEHGAEVLHVRSPHLPSIEPFVIDTNIGKRSCFLDLDAREDVERLRVLVSQADVFSQSYRGGSLAQRGFGPEDLATRHPGVIVVSINCYGHTGPWADRPGWEQLAQTVSGLAHEHGGTESASIIPAAALDYTTGYLGALGVMRALARRAVEGGSWHVRVSLARTAIWIESLPRVALDASPSGIDFAAVRRHQMEMETAWGKLTRLGPVLHMSETPPCWDLPPVPLGSDPARFQG